MANTRSKYIVVGFGDPATIILLNTIYSYSLVDSKIVYPNTNSQNRNSISDTLKTILGTHVHV